MSLFPELDQFDRGAVDTETTGLSSSDVPVGLSISLPDGSDRYLRWGHPSENNCSLEQVQNWAGAELPKLRTVVMHNGPFDMRMCAGVGLDPLQWRVEDTGTIAALLNELEPSFALDDLSKKYTGVSKSDQELNEWCAKAFGGPASRRGQAKNYHRAPGNIVEPYACGDSRMTLDLYDARRPMLTEEGLEDLYRLECQQLPIVLKMHRVGVRVDVDKAVATKKRLEADLREAKAKWESIAPGVSYTSTKQMAAYFDALGIPYRHTEKGNPSITKNDLEKLAEEGHDFALLIMKMKQLGHYAGTFIESYILDNVDEHGFVHGEFHPVKREKYGTVSGRYSSGGGLNLQNVPARDPVYAPLIRGMYIPMRPDMDWVKFDYSQIEYRFLAHYAGGALRDAYVANPLIDFHQMVADMAGMDRKPAKNLNFAVVYGQGLKATAAQLGVPISAARDFISQYHERVPEARQLMDRAMNRAAQRGYITTWADRRRRFRRDGRRGYKALHKALNALLQGSAADLIKKAMVTVDEVIDWEEAVLHLTVHDELDLSIVKGERGAHWRGLIKEAMQDFKLTVPVVADCEVGPDWGHVKEVA